MISGNLKDNSSISKKILLVDDEIDLLELFRDGLEHFGFEVEPYANPENAVSSYKKDHYELLLFDIKMDKLNGVDLNEILKESKGKEKVCFFTATYYSTGQHSFYNKEFE